MNKITIASRESLLALWQTKYAQKQILEKLNIESDILTMKTKGDIILNKPLQQIGGKALFMKELEIAMNNGKADIAVHSLKDIPYELPKGFELSTFFPRENDKDAFVSNNFKSLNDLPKGAIIGTSSLRRKSQILNYRPDLVIKELRGNVQTRLKKLDNNEFDAIILASAGLIRLSLKDRITEYLSKEICLPAVGQGVVAIEVLSKNSNLIEKLSSLTCQKTYKCILAERTFNEELKGGCNIAIAANAIFNENNEICLTALVANNDGSKVLKDSIKGINAIEIANKLAQRMIKNGAYKILES